MWKVYYSERRLNRIYRKTLRRTHDKGKMVEVILAVRNIVEKVTFVGMLGYESKGLEEISSGRRDISRNDGIFCNVKNFKNISPMFVMRY